MGSVKQIKQLTKIATSGRENCQYFLWHHSGLI